MIYSNTIENSTHNENNKNNFKILTHPEKVVKMTIHFKFVLSDSQTLMVFSCQMHI